jgi:hypothetical protein
MCRRHEPVFWTTGLLAYWTTGVFFTNAMHEPVPERGPVESFIIDHVERPTPN